jgi:hypothetical protein
MAEENARHVRKGPARVHIYGAGIAGLTAAHELARRGFRVRIYEPAQEYDERGRPETGTPLKTSTILKLRDLLSELAVGGLARSQFLRVAKGALGNFPQEGQFTACDEYRLPYDYSRDWGRAPGTNDWGLSTQLVFDFLSRPDLRQKAPGILHIRVPGPSESERTPTRMSAAQELVESLQRNPSFVDPSLLILVDTRAELFAQRMGAPFPPLEDKDELLVELLHFLPGEHGFRFFPASYRHLSATMAETPILDEQGRPTGRRVPDNLVPASFHGIAAQGRRIRFASSGAPSSPDTLQSTLRLWRYLCTCSERRKAEYEQLSWREYLEGHDPRTNTRRYQYSGAFKRDLWLRPRVPAVLDGAWSDARTHGNTLAQLYLNHLLALPGTDATLNGPTTPAWLRPWRRYLEEHLRVEFFQGQLTRLEFHEGRPIPYVKDRSFSLWERPDTQVPSWSTAGSEPVDYHVVATDAVSAEQLTRSLPPIGVIQGLRGFTSLVPPNPRGPEPQRPREDGVLPGHVPWDRFQTRTSIQFFFPASVRLPEGCLHFLDAPWELSAINSHQYWAFPPRLAQDGFAAVLSVDIGNWYPCEPENESPSGCSRHELAHQVWGQIRTALEQHQAPPLPACQSGFALPEPSWYHVDRLIRFETDPATGRERAVENQAPYLVPILGDWERRPGPEPWDPWASTAPEKPKEPLPEGLWQAPHGGYPVHWGRLVFAGAYLKTFTRVTTMESANESARHAVNAIIDHYLAHTGPQKEAQQGTSTVPCSPSQGRLTGSPAFGMTPIGEYCRIWDPEKHELPELASLRELDARLFASGLPHVWDVLELEPLVLPLLPALDSPGGAEPLRELLRDVRERMETSL